MTNKEKYKRTFAALHASENFMEVTAMKNTKRAHIPRLVAVCAAIALMLGLASLAYAADVGGIQRTIQLWIHGEQTNVVLDITHDGYTAYTATYTDADGTVHEQSGGGAASDLFGGVRPLTEDEIIEHLKLPNLEYRDDGTVWLYNFEQSIEITDKFDEDGVCRVQLLNGDETLYVSIVKGAPSFNISKHKFLD